MRQNITQDDLRELTPEEQQALRSLWKPSMGDLAMYEDGHLFVVCNDIDDPWPTSLLETMERATFRTYTFERCLPLLSIGQMVEILADKQEVYLHIHKDWKSAVFSNGRDVDDYTPDSQAPELCDALWAAVKGLLGFNATLPGGVAS